MIRTILSPGVELKEIDKSQYVADLATTPRALIMGFADKGPAKLTTDITSMADFRTIYGTPTNEPERYFYNAAEQMIGVGSTVVAAKIPYSNDNNYAAIQYSVSSTTFDTPTNTLLYLKGDATPNPATVTTASVTSAKVLNYKLNAQRVILGTNCTSIGASAFKDFKELESVSFADDDSITLGNNAFENCENLSRITLPSSQTALSEAIFKGCTSLYSVTLPSAITTIPSAAFEDCESLTQINLSKITTINANSFKNCNALTRVVLDSVATIGANAFNGCTRLESVIIKSTLTSVDATAFAGCTNLNRIYIENMTKADVVTMLTANSNWGLTNCLVQCEAKSAGGEGAGTYAVGTVSNTRSIKNLILADLEEIENEAERTVEVGALSTPSDNGLADVRSLLHDMDPSIDDLIVVKSSNCVKVDSPTFLALDSGDRADASDKTNIAAALPQNSFIIVDKSRGKYKTFTGNGSNVDCLGLLPVVTTAVNAMAIANNIDGVNMNTVDDSQIATVNEFEPLDKIKYITDLDSAATDDSEISSFWAIGPKTIANANTLNSISKVASTFFPSVNYSSQVSATASETTGLMPFDHNYFSYIGIVVFRVNVERGTGCLVAEPIEAFAGSLLEDAKDLRTNASTFIENVVNTTSNYINIFVSEDLARNASELMNKTSILYANPADGVILGLPPSVKKSICFTDITENMEDVFKAQSNILASTLDVVVDAGLSTIAECVNGTNKDNAKEVDNLQLIKGDDGTHNGPWPGWRKIVNLMKKFCESTRKDCTFVVDAPRFLALKNQRKIVSAYDSTSSITENILPKIKLISGIGTSYGWGYTTWFKIGCGADGTTFWCPPSIFGAARYIDTRTRWNTWDAPAGLTRGVVSVDDTAFEPDLNARNVIYSNGWNYALTDVQHGVTTLEGQKTFQSYTSAFDRINVRSLFLDLERRVFKIARNYIYEPNTADTRQQFVDNIIPIFSSTMAAGGCYDYKIICDESINTPQVIDNNELRIRIGVQPTKTIEFILMEFVACRTGSDWSELIME